MWGQRDKWGRTLIVKLLCRLLERVALPKGNGIIKQLKVNGGFSIPQIERAACISRGTIAKVDK